MYSSPSTGILLTITDSCKFQVGLIALLIEHCTVIAEVMGLLCSNLVQAWRYFHNCLVFFHNRDDLYIFHPN